MALDKETTKKVAQGVWGVRLGIGDNVLSPVAISINYAEQDLTHQTYNFAQAIYALGVAEERERIAKSLEGRHWVGNSGNHFAEEIRKGL